MTRSLPAILRERTFRSLQHRNYRLYFFGQLISFTGTWMQSAALLWFVYDLTNDPTWPAWLVAAQVAPTQFLGTFGGAIADRFAKRSILFGTQFLFLFNALILVMLVTTGLVTPWLLCLLQFLNGIVQSIDLPTRLAYVPNLIPHESLMNAVSLNSLLFNAARAVGPALAAAIFALAGALSSEHSVHRGAAVCFLLNALSFVAVLFTLSWIDVPGRRSQDDAAGRSRDGWIYLYQHPRLVALLVATAILCATGWPVLTLFPPYVKTTLHRAEGEYGLLLGALGAGALAAALTTATFGSVERRGLFLVLGALGECAGLLGLSQANDFVTAVLAAVLLGFGLILFMSTGQSVLQLGAPDPLRGRVMAFWAITISAGSPVGQLISGELARNLSVDRVFFFSACLAGLNALLVIRIAMRPPEIVPR